MSSDDIHQPTPRDLLGLELPVAVRVSPGGRRVAISVRSTNWHDDRYERICYVHDVAMGRTCRLTRTGHVRQMEWIDDETLALLKQEPEHGDEAQVWLYEGLVGEGWAVTAHEGGVTRFKPFAGGLLFVGNNPERAKKKARSDRFGTFTHFEQEDSAAALYYTGLAEMRAYQAQFRAAAEDEAKGLPLPVVELSRLLPERLSIRTIVAAPAGDAVYLNCRSRDDEVYYLDTSTYRIEVDATAALAEHLRRASAKGEAKEEDCSYLGQVMRLNLPRGARLVGTSPDGQKLLVAYQGRDLKMYTREDLWVVDLQTALQAADEAAFRAAMRNISAGLDRGDVMDKYWVPGGIFGSYIDGTHIAVARFGEDGQATPLDLQGVYPSYDLHVSAAGCLAMVGANARSLPEAYLATPAADGTAWEVRRLTDFGRAAEGWDLGTVETIRWRSADGTEIEGVLRKPAGFDPAKQYPLVLIVHGGPNWFSPAYLLSDYEYYPAVQLVNKGVLVLEPNYRGSAGRGQAFAELNVNNLGVGDLWDLESAIEHLAQLGCVDTARVGCMGWSQGGYISAFAGLHSERFRAVSVGAGISDWYTYHISNDIPAFTVDYLSGSPFRDRALYAKTAPISNIANAHTPMLIQHGADDRRVPLSDAMELYRGLKEMGVPVELFVFPGMGHAITKPREKHAVVQQNLAWFSHYLLGEALELE